MRCWRPKAQPCEVADALQSLDANFFRAVRRTGALAGPWLAHFTKVMDAAASDPDFAEADQLGAVGSKLTAIKVIKGAVPAGVARAASARVASALAGNQIPYVRSGIINAVLPIYEVLGQNEQAYMVVQGELAKTATPYYYKADLGDLAEALGRKDEALKWFSEGVRRGARAGDPFPVGGDLRGQPAATRAERRRQDPECHGTGARRAGRPRPHLPPCAHAACAP